LPPSFEAAGPNAAGEFTVSFESPRGLGLVKGKHQIIFQVFVGGPKAVGGEPVLRQLDVRDGRYEVPVKVPPDRIDDTRVVVTFVTVQPDHDAWVQAFFRDGKGTGYSGIWAADQAAVPAIPFEAPR
jgi:hypothetical protein